MSTESYEHEDTWRRSTEQQFYSKVVVVSLICLRWHFLAATLRKAPVQKQFAA